MKTEFLKELGLTEEQIKSVMAENGKDIKAEKDKTTKAETDLTNANAQLESANKTIKELKKNNGDNEALQTKVTEYENQIKSQKTAYEKQIRDMKLNSAIDNALLKEKAKHSELLSSKIDRDKLVINDDGTITGLDEQITGLKTNYKDLFEATVTGKAPENHENVGGSQITKEQFNKMTYNERLDLYNKNPDLYHNLQEE
ncbi:MAG: phage scaffolding protein [Clostridiaceae bacterium]|nr:phage scaffolding protein [Clostridiaceae bacterium]